MHIKEDPRFKEAARCLLATWLAQDAGERADEEAERYRHLAHVLECEYGKTFKEVAHLISAKAQEKYMEDV